ncbi:hypothetical protein [Cryobacterium sp. CG_9.6]|uniref:hypothetical protein n=1 Tax=Cryobacterium sp. CG_9.6 TaxID=2760710 RepID=UPI0024760FCB|nr:hypothetical protein [Cryobacterium sp. CG_9.6]MDH6235349.1 hypothetical protein [Cryobacterium sp. CG_9.6]
MKSDWVAASVRARSLAERRVGAGACQQIATLNVLTDLNSTNSTNSTNDPRRLSNALALLADTTYGAGVAGCTEQGAAEHAIRSTVLWHIRVLAGWIPATGTRLVRAVAAGYERDNIVALAHTLGTGQPAGQPFELGALATAWPRLREATSVSELDAALRTSPWAYSNAGEAGAGSVSAGDSNTGETSTPADRDVLTLVWLTRIAAVAGAARPWAEAAAGLLVARMLLVDQTPASPRLCAVARPLLGRAWERAGTLADLRASLPRGARDALRHTEGPLDLWRSEARLRARVEAEGFRLLRGAMPGPDIVLGGIAVLAMDAWRVRAALSAAAAGIGHSEVLDALA